jgi:hypothetical protein
MRKSIICVNSNIWIANILLLQDKTILHDNNNTRIDEIILKKYNFIISNYEQCYWLLKQVHKDKWLDTVQKSQNIKEILLE